MGIEKYKIVWFNVKQTKAPLNCVQYCGKDTLVLPVYAWTLHSLLHEVAPYQRLPSWQTAFSILVEAEWVIDTTESVMNWVCWLILPMWQFSHGVCRKHVHPWKSKMNCMQGKEEILLYLSVLVNVSTPDLNKDMTKPTFLQVTPTAWLNAKILTGSSYILTKKWQWVYIQL